MLRLHCLLLLAITISCSHVKQASFSQQTPNAIPALHVILDSAQADLRISRLAVDVVVIGNRATTTFDITFYNSHERVLEGEFDFPLANGQSVTRYALEVGGNLREGVVVEKAKARVAYEATIRRGIDPGLVEKTAGNNFRTRIYPIPAKGYKRVVIGMEQPLSMANEAWLYSLPMQAKEPIDSFSIDANVFYGEAPRMVADSLPRFEFRRIETGYEGNYQQMAFSGNHLFAFTLPVDEEMPVSYTEKKGAKTWFYAAGKLKAVTQQKTKPKTVGLLWDVSASAAGRNHQKEQALLKEYLAASRAVEVLLIPFHITTQPIQLFSAANTEALMQKLSSLDYDGGTQLGALHLSQYKVDEFLLFSDGLSTFGNKNISLGNKPVIAITSSPSADYSNLKFITTQTGGVLVDLTKTETAEGVAAMLKSPLHLAFASVTDGHVDSLVTVIDEASQSFAVAGLLRSREADINLAIDAGESSITQAVHIAAGESIEGVSRLWATMQINEMNLRYEANKKQITELGKAFSVVTRNTSLLVLDRVEDYVRYRVVPPVDLQQEYFELVAEADSEKKDEKEEAMNEALTAMEELKTWWKKDFRKDAAKRKQKNQRREGLLEVDLGAAVAEADSSTVRGFANSYQYHRAAPVQAQTSSSQNAEPPPPPPPVDEGKGTVAPSSQSAYRNNGEYFLQGRAAGVQADEIEISNLSEVVVTATSSNKSSSISVAEWKSNATYLKALDKAGVRQAYKTYLAEKKQYAAQPSFHLDVARWFFEKGKKEEALRILSNVAELKLESPELLRMMAYQLLDMQEKKLAVITFRELLALREEEPQAYRDLALVLSETGNHQEAIDLLNQIITGVWDDRFDGIKTVVLNELNGIISAYGKALNAAAVDNRFIQAMPVDVRITIDWNTDNSDVDLWVTDPKKEKCFYENKETQVGGRISNDMIQGYGPEEFLVKKAANGEYVIEANLYGDTRQTIGGPITIRANLYTDWGKPTQKHKRINLRVTENKEVVKVGTLRFG